MASAQLRTDADDHPCIEKLHFQTFIPAGRAKLPHLWALALFVGGHPWEDQGMQGRMLYTKGRDEEGSKFAVN